MAQRPRTASDPEGLVSEQEQAVAAARRVSSGLALGVRTLRGSGLAPVQRIQQLPLPSWLILGGGSFLVATENAKNWAFGPVDLVLESLPPSCSPPTRFALGQIEASAFSKFGARHHI